MRAAMDLDLLRTLSQEADSKIVLLVLDGLGGLPKETNGPTELEAARTPNLDRLASLGTTGMIEPVGPGITPGSGPGHLGLFGYDPLRYQVGRGVLSALGIGFDLRPGDVAARGNFCTVDEAGRVTDRRAGRISTETNAELCERLSGIELEGVEVHVETVKEHRFLLVLRGDGLSAEIDDTDPQETGVEPHPPRARADAAENTARLADAFISAARERLSDRERANMVLLRGFGELPDWPRFSEVFGVRAAAVADYPMYRGVSRLVGMQTPGSEAGMEAHVEALERQWDSYDFFYLHEKEPDAAGEDGDFDRRVRLLEAADAALPGILEMEPDVLLVTGDHSTPALLRQHSWHPVPALLWSETARPDGLGAFSERECRRGGLGARFPATDLMPLAMAHAMRLRKFGA